jgi:anti-sigma factor RsiW
MMTCRQCAELLLEYLEGDLEGERAERIRQHLEACPPCVTFMETYRITITLTRKLPCAELPADVAQRLWAAMERCKGSGEKPT